MSKFISDLKAGLQLACQPTGIDLILQGRAQVISLPRELVLENIESVANECINWNDYWEYRRLLEVAHMLDAGLVQRFVARGLKSKDPEIIETASDFLSK